MTHIWDHMFSSANLFYDFSANPTETDFIKYLRFSITKQLNFYNLNMNAIYIIIALYNAFPVES